MIVGSRHARSKLTKSKFDVRSIERISGLTERQIQRVAQFGFIDSGKKDLKRQRSYSFQDILILRKIGQLISTQCSFPSVLTQIRDILVSGHSGQSLHALDIRTIGPHLVVQIEGTFQHVTSGQTFLNFGDEQEQGRTNVLQFPVNSDSPKSQSISALLPESELERMRASDELSSQDWFKLGLQFESFNEQSRAQRAYRNAMRLDQNNVDATINLGRLLQLEDKLREAKKLYEKVLQLRPESELANFNMGTLFDMLDEFELAIRYYDRAPNLAMAHQNLARIYDILGNEVQAARHTLRRHELDLE